MRSNKPGEAARLMTDFTARAQAEARKRYAIRRHDEPGPGGAAPRDIEKFVAGAQFGRTFTQAEIEAGAIAVYKYDREMDKENGGAAEPWPPFDKAQPLYIALVTAALKAMGCEVEE